VILAIESSCDESALAVFDPSRGIACEWVHSQISLHAEHGGVVPDLAVREHLKCLPPLVGMAASHPSWTAVDRIAVTRGPGLAACLAVGQAAAKAIAADRGLPVVGVNHLRAHAWSSFMPVHAASPETFADHLQALLPHLGLIVSGGNTLIFSISGEKVIQRISGTRDDAAGEALDKGAKLLGIGYPGGPAVERLAAAGRPDAYDFPRGLGERGDLDLSFSGLKTSLRYRVQAMSEEQVRASLADLCASYQQAVVDALSRKVGEALSRGGYRSVGLSGGVANNAALRSAVGALAARGRMRFLPAEPRHTGDNAAMVAFAAWADEADCADHAGPRLRVEPGAYL
jgi:N6-L-threonylcarbamoyladenine synthase